MRSAAVRCHLQTLLLALMSALAMVVSARAEAASGGSGSVTVQIVAAAGPDQQA